MRKTIGFVLLLLLLSASASILLGVSETHSSLGASDARESSWVWETNTSFLGGYGECVASDGKNIYILEEYKANYNPKFAMYDPSSGVWTDLSSNLPPKGTFKNGVAMAYDYSGNFYVLTGSAYADGADRVMFYRYNISTDTWTRLADTPHVQGAGDAIVYSAYDNMLYAFIGRAHYTGDYDPGDYGIFARYDPETDVWENLTYPEWTGTDDGASLAWTGGRYIYGLQGEFYENSPLRSFARYDIVADGWTNLSDMDTKDGVGDGGSLLWIGAYDENYSDVLFAFDGNGCNETPGYNFSMYYISNDTWRFLDTIPKPIGYYVGNRIAYASGKLWYWQGTPSTWGGGTGVFYYQYKTASIPEFSPDIISIFPLIVILISFLSRKRGV